MSNLIEYFFGEDQGRYILEIDQKKLPEVEKIIKNHNIFYEKIGVTQPNYFEINEELKIGLNDLFKVNNQWYKKY